MTSTTTEYRLDEVDCRILYALMQDARNTSAAALAEAANVSDGTIGNRISKLEEKGIIQGSTIQVDFERAKGNLTNLYLCDVPVAEREALALEARTIPEVINVRSLMTGQQNLHVLAVGEDMSALQRIARQLTDLGIHIRDEELVENELFVPYDPFNPDDTVQPPEPNDFVSLTDEANVDTITVQPGAPIAGLTLEEAGRRGVLNSELLILTIERNDRKFTPDGDTTVYAHDTATVLSRDNTEDDIFCAFHSTQCKANSK